MVAHRLLNVCSAATGWIDLTDGHLDDRAAKARHHLDRIAAALQHMAAGDDVGALASLVLPGSAGAEVSSSHPWHAPQQYARCGACERSGAYYSERHGVVRCKYCKAVLHVDAPTVRSEDLAAVALTLGKTLEAV